MDKFKKDTAISLQPYMRFKLRKADKPMLCVQVNVVSDPRNGYAMLDVFTGLEPMPLYLSPTDSVYIA